MHKLLDKIDSPADLRKLPKSKLKQLCAEIRDYMVECCAVNPGHLGSSLGAVELIVALHYIYNTPADKLVFVSRDRCSRKDIDVPDERVSADVDSMFRARHAA